MAVIFQSKGKKEIKVYIATVEQTDVDVDSITITKTVNAPHTATFVLGRPYDNTKPAVEAVVEIKYYSIWTLYKGYVTNIVPGNQPDTIKVNCQGEYWKQNRDKKYFFVGHKPPDNDEQYYDTIADALLSEFSWSPEIGEFVPQTMNCFGMGESDCITSLITNSGNYGWFYDEAGTKKLWKAGEGSIVTLERQAIGENLGLYQVLTHNFNEDVSNIVNRLRVNMGSRTERDLPKGYRYSYVSSSGEPDWDEDYETVSTPENPLAQSWKKHDADLDYLYKDIFKKYRLTYLNPTIASWTDRYPPQVTIRIPFGASDYSCSIPLIGFISLLKKAELEEGFSVDYESGLLTFSEAIFLYKVDEHGQISAIRRPQVELRLWKKEYFDETEDVTSPLTFNTDKMGDYPTEIFGFLELGGLSIQIGGQYKDADGDWVYIPSWDDTDFAENYADFQLSKDCDNKIKGTIELTLDAICLYGIDLDKRIDIPNVTEQALNIDSITYNIVNFTATIGLVNGRIFKRSVNLPYHGEMV